MKCLNCGTEMTNNQVSINTTIFEHPILARLCMGAPRL